MALNQDIIERAMRSTHFRGFSRPARTVRS